MLDGLGPYRTDDPQHAQVVRAEIDLQTVVTVGKRVTTITSESWAAPVRVRRLANLEIVPLAIAGKVRDESVRAHLRKVNGRWKPRLVTEPLNEEPLMSFDRDGEWLRSRECLEMLRKARHPTLRAMYAVQRDDPVGSWAEMAARVHQTEQWLRKLAEREFGEPSASR